MVPARDATALAAAIRALLDDPERCATLVALGRERVLRLFTYQQMAEATLSGYAQFLDRDLR